MSEERIGTVLDSKYELVSLLGEGGMGAVYEAKHRLINRRLAVKFLHPQYADNEEVVIRFQREAQSAAAIGHENIIEITDMGTADDGAPYIVMEYLKGTDVKGLIESAGIQTIGRTANIMVQALAGLQAAHNAGIIHRDLKPENVYLITKSSNPDYVKLLDFGISKFKELETDGQKALTQTGTVLGTPHYMSPEQARGEQDLTPRSDIYAMGIIMYQMLTGELPFDAPNYNALLIKILTEDPPAPEIHNPDLPQEITDIIKISMARDANDRFATCDEFAARLLPFATLVGGDHTGAIQVGSGAFETMRKVPTATNMTPLEMTQSGISTTKSKTPMIVGIIAAVLVAAAAAGAFVILGNDNGSGNASDSQNIGTVPVAAPAVEVVDEKIDDTEDKAGNSADDNLVKVSISVEPPEAKIYIDGVPVSNPYEGHRSGSKIDHPLVIKASGYEDYSAMVVFEEDYNLVHALEKVKKTSRSGKRRTSSSSSTGKKPKSVIKITSKPDAKPETAPTKKPRRKIDKGDPWAD